MNSNKFTQLHVYLIGAVLMVIVGVGMWFALLKPLYDDNKMVESSIQGTEGTPVSIDGHSFTIAQAVAAKSALEGAQKRKDQKTQELKRLSSRYELPRSEQIDLGDTGTDQEILQKTMANWLTLPRVVVPKMEQFAQSQARKHRVTVTTEFKAPAPPTDPKGVPRDIIAWNLGPMTVHGKFNDVMQWARSWDDAPLLVAVDGLKCSILNPKGEVEATCTLTTYIFPTGKAVQVPGAASSSGGGSSAGMPMGAPGMAPPGMAPPPGMGGGNGPPSPTSRARAAGSPRGD